MDESITKALEQIHEVINSFRDKFELINSKSQTIDLNKYRIDCLQKSIEDLEKWAIKGNGQPSFNARFESHITRLSLVEERLKEHANFIEDRKADEKKVRQSFIMAIASLGSALITALFAFLK